MSLSFSGSLCACGGVLFCCLTYDVGGDSELQTERHISSSVVNRDISESTRGADSITVFNNGRKNEKILKVAIPPERLSGERNSRAM